jgi:hypothetical protein
MLISSVRSLSDFSSAAGDVRMQVAEMHTYGRPAAPVTAVERRSVQAIRQLVELGARFGERPDGSLDVTGSSPEQIDLASALGHLIPNRLDTYKTDGRLDIRRWAETANSVLAAVERGAAWDELDVDSQRFVVQELEPFLVSLLNETRVDPAADD